MLPRCLACFHLVPANLPTFTNHVCFLHVCSAYHVVEGFAGKVCCEFHRWIAICKNFYIIVRSHGSLSMVVPPSIITAVNEVVRKIIGNDKRPSEEETASIYFLNSWTRPTCLLTIYLWCTCRQEGIYKHFNCKARSFSANILFEPILPKHYYAKSSCDTISQTCTSSQFYPIHQLFCYKFWLFVCLFACLHIQSSYISTWANLARSQYTFVCFYDIIFHLCNVATGVPHCQVSGGRRQGAAIRGRIEWDKERFGNSGG